MGSVRVFVSAGGRELPYVKGTTVTTATNDAAARIAAKAGGVEG